MNDDTTDPAERIARLQARRAASGRSPDPARPRTGDDTAAPGVAPRAPGRTGPPARGGRRRSHPAAATRWLLGGLSVASFFGIAGTVAAANVATTTAAVAAPAPATAPASTIATPTAATPVASAASGATPAPRAAPVVHTTTRGS